jgi:predicted NUDIX family NTP pyrophosphohydrolase
MKTISSAGILVYKQINGQLQVLLGHSTHKNPLSLTDRRWTILKGKGEKNETLWETAQREFKEESGFNINYEKFESFAENRKGQPMPVFEYELKTKENGENVRKVVSVFFLHDTLGLIDPNTLICESKIKNTNYVEIDGYCWVNLKAAILMAMPSQLGVIDKLNIKML